MADERSSEVLGALPKSRPHRRSAKRPVRNGHRADAPSPEATASGGERPATRPADRTAGGPRSGRKTEPRAVGGGPKRAVAGGSKRAVGGSKRAVGGSKRAGAAPPAARRKAAADRLRQPPQPRGIPSQPRSPVPPRSERPVILGTLVQAAAELTEIGLSLGSKVLQRAVSRLPRP